MTAARRARPDEARYGCMADVEERAVPGARTRANRGDVTEALMQATDEIETCIERFEERRYPGRRNLSAEGRNADQQTARARLDSLRRRHRGQAQRDLAIE